MYKVSDAVIKGAFDKMLLKAPPGSFSRKHSHQVFMWVNMGGNHVKSFMIPMPKVEKSVTEWVDVCALIALTLLKSNVDPGSIQLLEAAYRTNVSGWRIIPEKGGAVIINGMYLAKGDMQMSYDTFVQYNLKEAGTWMVN